MCTDPLVFGTLLGQDGPLKSKMHETTITDFGDLLVGIQVSVRSILTCAILALNTRTVGVSSPSSPGLQAVATVRSNQLS